MTLLFYQTNVYFLFNGLPVYVFINFLLALLKITWNLLILRIWVHCLPSMLKVFSLSYYVSLNFIWHFLMYEYYWFLYSQTYQFLSLIFLPLFSCLESPSMFQGQIAYLPFFSIINSFIFLNKTPSLLFISNSFWHLVGIQVEFFPNIKVSHTIYWQIYLFSHWNVMFHLSYVKILHCVSRILIQFCKSGF